MPGVFRKTIGSYKGDEDAFFCLGFLLELFHPVEQFHRLVFG